MMKTAAILAVSLGLMLLIAGSNSLYNGLMHMASAPESDLARSLITTSFQRFQVQAYHSASQAH